VQTSDRRRSQRLLITTSKRVADAGFVLRLCTISLKFVGLPVQKIWRTSGLSISRPGTLTFDLETAWWGARGVDNILTNFCVSIRGFVLDLSANICQRRHMTLRS